ncbi:MAG: EAL domain-containing protein [Thermodesulfobacteriota bacterium]
MEGTRVWQAGDQGGELEPLLGAWFHDNDEGLLVVEAGSGHVCYFNPRAVDLLGGEDGLLGQSSTLHDILLPSKHYQNRDDDITAELQMADGSWVSRSFKFARVASHYLVRVRPDGAASPPSSHHNFEQIEKLLPLGIFEVDSDLQLVHANGSFYQLLGQAEDELGAGNWLDNVHGADSAALSQQVGQAIKEKGSLDVEVRLVDGQGQQRWVALKLVTMRDGAGELSGMLGVMLDIDARRVAEESVWELAHYDPLTRLLNRNSATLQLHEALKRSRRRGLMALLYLDLDGFKAVNDNLGHGVGDILLQTVANRIRNLLRNEDNFARLGGDEFCVVLEAVGRPVNGVHLAQQIVELVRRPYEIDGRMVRISASIGVATCRLHGERTPQVEEMARDLLRHADMAMYEAKKEGRDRVHLYDPSLDSWHSEQLELMNDLSAAMAQEQFQLSYQPQVDFASGRVVGVEALLAWHHPERGGIPANRFIPLLEETGLIHAMGRWVLERALADYSRTFQHLATGDTPFSLAVNLAPAELSDTELPDVLAQMLVKYRVRPHCLLVEITESGVLADRIQALEVIQSIRALGVGVALDDFGTGHSSLSLLHTLPLTQLKLDRRFIKGLPRDGDGAAMCRTMLALAKSMELETVAEGVESKEQHQFLRELGCELFQGFICSPAVTPEAIVDMAELECGVSLVGTSSSD